MSKKEEKEKQRREAGEAYRAEILGIVKKGDTEIPEEKLKVVEEVLGSEAVVDFLGSGVHRQSDYSRGMDALRDQQKLLDAELEKAQKLFKDNIEWRAKNKDDVDRVMAENARMRKRLANLDDDDIDDASDDRNSGRHGLSREDAEKLVADRVSSIESQGLTVMAALTNLQGKHMKEFGEPLVAEELIQTAQDNGVNLVQAYEIHVAERREEARSKARDEELEKVRQETREKTLEEVRQSNTSLPHLVGNTEPTISEQLKADRSGYGVKAALDEHYRANRPGTA